VAAGNTNLFEFTLSETMIPEVQVLIPPYIEDILPLPGKPVRHLFIQRRIKRLNRCGLWRKDTQKVLGK
jgi:hypothetical protein